MPKKKKREIEGDKPNKGSGEENQQHARKVIKTAETISRVKARSAIEKKRLA